MSGPSCRACLLGLLALLGSPPVSARGPRSGFELALHQGGGPLLGGRPARFRGIAYRVLGLAELSPLPGAVIRARAGIGGAGQGSGRPRTTSGSGQSWRETRADARGFFVIEVPMPERPPGPPILELRVGDGKQDRLFVFDLKLERPWTLDLCSDRQLYQAGESIHAWARLRDTRSGRPLAGQPIHFTLTGTGARSRPVLTDASGVAALQALVPPQAAEGSHALIARVGGEEVRRGYRIGVRTYERLFATVKVTPPTAQPHQRVSVEVKVSTPSGAPVRNAVVEVTVDRERSASARTDGKGLATVPARAPAYMTHATGQVPVQVRIAHPAHGSALASHTLRLAVPLALEVTVVAPNAGLVPELDGPLYLQLRDGAGDPAPAGTPVEVRGAAVSGGRQRARTDVHGIAVVPARLPVGAASGADEDGAGATASLTVQVGGAAPRTAIVSVPVRGEVEVRPSVEKPVVAPGAPVAIRLARRASARRLPAIVELLQGGVVEARVVAPGEDRIVVSAPRDRLGVIQVRARALRQRGVVEGAGGLDALIVRPARAWFPTLSAKREVHQVRSTARLVLETGAGGPPGWAAVLVRDLAAHAGEHPFELYFMERAFDRAVLDPSTRAAATLLRTALAAHVAEDQTPRPAPALLDTLGQPLEAQSGLEASPGRGVLRDPFPLADELRRRGLGKLMLKLEELLEEALDEGRLDEITHGRGTARRFRADLLEELEEVPPTLGEGKLTLAMLEAADPSFSYGNLARRVARARLVQLLVALAHYLDPGDDATPQQRSAAKEPSARWLGRMVERGLIEAHDLADPWGGRFTLRKTRRRGALVLAVEAAGLELVSPGPDGRLGTGDDLHDPFARVIPRGTPYAVASGEDALIRELARLSPDQKVIERLLAAYKRVAADVAEEEIGDAVRASVSEGRGDLVGEAHGVGGLGLRGTGRGGGGTGSGTIGLGRVGTIGHGSGAGFASAGGLAWIVRERFPPTLHFAPSIPLDPSGKTPLELKLSDAVTSYQVEAVVWSAEGWSWSARTRIRVDQDVVVDAPVPLHASVGDLLRLPVRIGNRSVRDQRLTLEVAFAGKAPSAPLFRRAGIVVPAGDSIQLPVELRLARPFDGHLVIRARSAEGAPLDAIRRPLAVTPATRRVRWTEEALASGAGSLRLEVPAGAIAGGGSELRVQVGAGLFQAPADAGWAAWAEAWSAPPVISAIVLGRLRGADGGTLARAVASSWAAGERTVSDRLLGDALKRLTRTLDRTRHLLDPQLEILLGLAPIVASGQLRARARLTASLEAILRGLRQQVSSRVGEIADAPGLWATAAAALAWTAPPGAELARVRELVRRVRRHQLEVGDQTWVAVRGAPDASALLALAEMKLSETGRAFALVRSLGRREGLGSPALALARAAAALLFRGTPARVARLEVDGRVRELTLVGGLARAAVPELGAPGVHRVRVEASGALHLHAVAEYGLPWSVRPGRGGPLEVSLEGATPARDQRAKLVLAVRNRSPRSIGQPVLELGLPAGAELDEEARVALRRQTVAEPAAIRGTLRLELASLPPGSTRRLPLPLRFSVGGRLQGLGVSAHAADRPEEISITPPRGFEIAESGGQP